MVLDVLQEILWQMKDNRIYFKLSKLFEPGKNVQNLDDCGDQVKLVGLEVKKIISCLFGN